MSSQVLVLSKDELQQLIKSTVVEALAESQHQIKSATPAVYLTRREAMEHLRTTYPTLHKHTESGLLKCETFGRKKLYNKVDLDLALSQFRTIQGNRHTRQ